MKKKILLITTMLLLLTGCTKNENALRFKDDYEKLNNQKNSANIEYRSVSINENNPFIYVTDEKIVDMIENKETFYVYFGDKMCPWCRSVIEKSIEIAQKNKISKIYYVNIWDDEHNEIVRDKYELDKNGKPKITIEGTESYHKLLDYFKDFLKDYTLTNEKGTIVEVCEKRIFAPNFFYIENGETKKMVSGISEKQENYNSELTKEILEDEIKIFKEFFTN